MSSKNTYFTLSEKGIKHLVPFKDILHIEAVRVYTIFYLRHTLRQLVSSQSLGKVLEQLNPEQFLRIHKSHIVNLHEIKAYLNARGGKVILSNNTEIEVAQRRKTELLRHLHQINKKAKQQPEKKKTDPRIIIRSNPTK